MGKWGFLFNRYVVTLVLIVAGTALWNLYIARNDDGIIRGRVLGPDGAPVAGAEVVLSERTLFVSEPRARTVTDESGAFRFTGHRLYRVWLQAAKDGVGAHPQTEYRLYFRGANLDIETPLRLDPNVRAHGTRG